MTIFYDQIQLHRLRESETSASLFIELIYLLELFLKMIQNL